MNNTKHSSATVNITRFKLRLGSKYAIHFIVGGEQIVYYPIKTKITQLIQKQGVITQLNKTLSVAPYNIALSLCLCTVSLIDMSSVLTLAFKPDFC